MFGATQHENFNTVAQYTRILKTNSCYFYFSQECPFVLDTVKVGNLAEAAIRAVNWQLTNWASVFSYFFVLQYRRPRWLSNQAGLDRITVF